MEGKFIDLTGEDICSKELTRAPVVIFLPQETQQTCHNHHYIEY